MIDELFYHSIPQFEDPIALCAIDESGTYHLLKILNYDKICVDFWNEETAYISEYTHDTLTTCVVQCKFTYISYQLYGELEGEMDIVDVKVLWQNTPKTEKE